MKRLNFRVLKTISIQVSHPLSYPLVYLACTPSLYCYAKWRTSLAVRVVMETSEHAQYSVRAYLVVIMADAPDGVDKPLEELEEEITCGVCHGHYQQAKLLPCNHYYCAACIEEMAKHSKGKPFDCPECRKTTTLPPGGVAELDGAFFVERMKDVYGKMAKAEGKVEAVCEQCEEGKAVAFCRQCTEFICEDCVRSHQKLKVFAGHKVTSLADLKRGGAKHITLKEAPLPKCPDHDELMKIFCFDCNRLVCRDCVLYDHREHKSDFVKKRASESRKTLRDSLAPLLKVQDDIAGAEKAIVAEKTLVSTQNVEICKSIQQSFDNLEAILNQCKVELDQRKAELVKQANILAQSKEAALTAQMRELQVAQTEIQSLVKLVEQNLENTSDQNVMSICTQLQTKMEEGEKHHRKICLKPVTTADIVCSPPSLDIVPRELGAVFTEDCASALIVEVPKLSSVGEPTQFSVKVPQSMGTNVQVQLKSLVDPHCIVSASVVTTGNDDTYLITYTPRVRGRHDLTVRVNGKDIVGSPYRVFVKIHPTQLGRPVRKIDGLNDPHGITINNKEQLVVAEGDGKKITIVERDGKRVQNIDCVQRLCGVATGPDGDIYVTDMNAYCLFKFSTDGKLCKKVSNLSCPFFVKVIQGQLYVTNHNKNEVKIFDMDCNAVGSITTSECPFPEDIAERDGNLYVGSYGRGIGVYQCIPGGSYMRHINTKDCRWSRGLCFDKCGFLYVVFHEFDSEVYVFDHDDKIITSFGLGVIQNPTGLVIDDDGFVYICDHSCGSVFVF